MVCECSPLIQAPQQRAALPQQARISSNPFLPTLLFTLALTFPTSQNNQSIFKWNYNAAWLPLSSTDVCDSLHDIALCAIGPIAHHRSSPHCLSVARTPRVTPPAPRCSPSRASSSLSHTTCQASGSPLHRSKFTDPSKFHIEVRRHHPHSVYSHSI